MRLRSAFLSESSQEWVRGPFRFACAFLRGELVIRNWMMKRRFQNAAMKSPHFMLRNDGGRSRVETPECKAAPTSQQLRQLLHARQARANFFGAHLFADPAWDILILAYVALLEQERLLVSAVCRASAVPATTTLRWVKALEQDGWLVRGHDPLDGPQACLELSAAGKIGMERYLALFWPTMPV